MKEDEEKLPLGSVVRLQEGSHEFMIVQRLVLLPFDNETRLIDYGGCMFPEGVIGGNLVYFNHEDIDQVQFVGCKTKKEYMYDDLMKEYAANHGIKHITRDEICEMKNREKVIK